MKSAIRIEALIQCFLQHELSRDIHSQLKGYLVSFDCQDTDNDNKTECYFYFSPEIGKNLANGFVRELATILGVPEGCALQSQCDDGRLRIAFVVEIACIYPANSEGRFTLTHTTVKSEPINGELVTVKIKRYDSKLDAQRGLAGNFAEYVQNNCETLVYADIRPFRAVVRYADGVTEVFQIEEAK